MRRMEEVEWPSKQQLVHIHIACSYCYMHGYKVLAALGKSLEPLDNFGRLFQTFAVFLKGSVALSYVDHSL